MKFSVIPSPLDEEYDPVAQFYWNLTNGFAQNPKDFDIEENSEKNAHLINSINLLFVKFKEAIGNQTFTTNEEAQEWLWDDGNDERLFEVLNMYWNPILIRCDQYTDESSNALCQLLEFLRKYSLVFENLDQFSDYIPELIDIFSEPQCPRNVVWHLVNDFYCRASGVCDDDYTPFLHYSIGRNPLIGDKAFITHINMLTKSLNYEFTPSTAYDAFKNPSLTALSLSKLTPNFHELAPEYIEIFISPNQYRWDLQKIGGSTGYSSGISMRYNFALVVARVFDEVKLGRVSWEELITSESKYFRTIAFYNPKTNVADKSRLLKTEIVEIDGETLEFLSYSFTHPYISALSPELAGKPFN